MCLCVRVCVKCVWTLFSRPERLVPTCCWLKPRVCWVVAELELEVKVPKRANKLVKLVAFWYWFVSQIGQTIKPWRGLTGGSWSVNWTVNSIWHLTTKPVRKWIDSIKAQLGNANHNHHPIPSLTMLTSLRYQVSSVCPLVRWGRCRLCSGREGVLCNTMPWERCALIYWRL